jgi:hypothetical protein
MSKMKEFALSQEEFDDSEFDAWIEEQQRKDQEHQMNNDFINDLDNFFREEAEYILKNNK